MLPQGLVSLLLATCFCSWLGAAAALAAEAEIPLSGRIVGTAEFRPGQAGKPAILVLHGFLQTREFGIVRSLADELAGAGYTVLAPNLSLGISRRKSSLSCEALHLHDMEGDIGEIQQWVQWLKSRGHTRIIGIGHSFGAVQLMAWREKHRQPRFPLIGVSAMGIAPLAPAARARAVQQGKPSGDLVEAPLSFCKIYPAPAAKHASYSNWDEKRILDALGTGSAAIDIILGSNDNYLPPGWAGALTRAGARVRVIKGANHFMEGTQEFDLFETVHEILQR